MSEDRGRRIIMLAMAGLVGLFGLFCLFLPGPASAALALLFGLAILATAVLAVVEALSLRKVSQFWPVVLIEGAVNLALGLTLILVPDAVSFVVRVLGAWVITLGVFRLVRGVLRSQSGSPVLVPGLGSAAIGIVLFLFPGAVQQILTFVVGAALVLFAGVVIWSNVVALRHSSAPPDASAP